MSATLAHGKADGVSRLELSPPVRRPELRAPGDYDDQLLLGNVPVVGVGGLPGRQLEQAESDLLGSQLPSQSRAQAREARVLSGLIENRAVDVHAHGFLSVGCSP